MYKIIVLALGLFFIQQEKTVSLEPERTRLKKGERELKIRVHNSGREKAYYVIGLRARTDTGWVAVSGDIRRLGQKDVKTLSPLRAGGDDVQILRLQAIPENLLQGKQNWFVLRLSYAPTASFFDPNFIKRDYDIAIEGE